MGRSPRALSTWSFEEGVLRVTHRGETVSLGRYATHALAAKAAALYIAKQGAEAPSGAESRPE
jgi:hypothetical protein